MTTNPLTPMLRQYLGIKEEYRDSILFFRMGDFYEMFFEDAVTASGILGITLTSRGTHNGRKVPMCGVPHHSSKSYVSKLIEHGWKVAICEQVEDPRLAKEIVRREVIRVVTPGSVTEEGETDAKANLYIAALCGRDGRYGLAHVDLSTGEFRVTEVEEWARTIDELGRIQPAELLTPEGYGLTDRHEVSSFRTEILSEEDFDPKRAEEVLKEQMGVFSLAGFGCDAMEEGIVAAAAIVHYLRKTQKVDPEHIREIVTYRLGDFMFLDESTAWTLELFQTMRRRTVKGSLFHVLDRTLTPMGGRLLKRWIGYPLIDLKEINRRLAAVTVFREDPLLRSGIGEELKQIYDLERLNGRIALGRANARDLVALGDSVQRLPAIKEKLTGSTSELLSEIAEKTDTLQDLADWIKDAICEDPPVSIKEGGLIREGYSPELDELISITRDGKSWLARHAASEQKRTGISSLKIAFNKIYGYYIEVTKANLHLVPPEYVRKQTLVNAERFTTEELKNYEEKVLGAEEKKGELEFELFEGLRKKIALENRRIKATAALTAAIDVLCGLAETAEFNGYVRPEIEESGRIDIVDGRHPVIEQMVRQEPFVPNDVHLDDQEQQILMITGPNMSGKSTILRQTALIVLMAQMGSFIPAAKAAIGIVDRIFTRVGASDDLGKGRSTFMVEMNETANILRHATTRSLVILDEIGRGTSTYDGLSIAWAVAEALHDREDRGVRTLFATHYHELMDLAASKSRVKNFNIAVKEWKDRIIFLRKMVPGGTSRSYGIQVARIAGLPELVIRRAKEILENLERKEIDEAGKPEIARSRRNKAGDHPAQLHLFAAGNGRLEEWIKGLEINHMTPLQAIEELNKLQSFLTEGQ